MLYNFLLPPLAFASKTAPLSDSFCHSFNIYIGAQCSAPVRHYSNFSLKYYFYRAKALQVKAVVCVFLSYFFLSRLPFLVHSILSS